jgi:hypothetical protein
MPRGGLYVGGPRLRTALPEDGPRGGIGTWVTKVALEIDDSGRMMEAARP